MSWEHDPKKVRDHGLDFGLGDTRQFVDGAPRIKGKAVGLPACPNCGCPDIFEVEVTIKGHPLLKTGAGIGTYLGCAACPMASPMVMVAGAGKDSKSNPRQGAKDK